MRLKDLREDRDETQRQMAALLNVGQSTYSMYENGQREIPLAALCKLADHYDMLKTLTNTYFDIPDFYQMVSECIPGAGSAKMRPYLLDIDQAFARLNYLLDMYLSILSRESREAFDEVCAKIKNRYGTSGERGGSAWANIWVKPSTLA